MDNYTSVHNAFWLWQESAFSYKYMTHTVEPLIKDTSL